MGAEGKDKPKQCARNSDGASLRRAGETASNVGATLRIGGAIVGVGAPPAGAAIALYGTAIDLFGIGLTAGGYAVEGDFWGGVGFAGDALVERLTGKAYSKAAKGALRNPTTGRFSRNPLGGQYREAKRRGAEEAAGSLSGATRRAIVCPR